jgi:hypothetical protein
MIPVINGIEEPVKIQTRSASTHTAVIGKDLEVITESRGVRSGEILNEDIACSQRFRRHHVWSPSMSACSLTALWTESAAPLPRSPSIEFRHRDFVSNPLHPLGIRWGQRDYGSFSHPGQATQ